jgi:P4 family phage/plasmid primase-like protien
MSEKPNVNKSDDDAIIRRFVAFMKSVIIFKDKVTGDYLKTKTHTVMGILHEKYANHCGSFSIEGKNYNTFIKLYKSVLGKMPLYIVERLVETGKMTGPFIIDIDYRTPVKNRQYTIDHIKKVTEISNAVFLKYLNINKYELKAYVTEKKKATWDEKEFKDGFHIFYDIALDYNTRKFLFDEIREQIVKKNVFEDIDTHTPPYEIIDERVMIKNGILMHGSTKKGRQPYELTHVFDWNVCELPIEDYNDDDKLVDVFSLRKYADEDIVEFRSEHFELEKEIKSRVYSNEKVSANKKICESALKKTDATNNTKHVFDPEKLSSDHRTVYEYINIMSEKRATTYDGWTRVGWALHNISPKLYDVFINFSKKAKNFDEKGCEKLWYNANREKTGLTIASIKMWAREDNEEEYNKIRHYRVAKILDRIETPNDNDIADFIVELYSDIYKCASITKKVWYEFKEHRWVNVDSGYTLLEKIANDVAEHFAGGFAVLMRESAQKGGITGDDAWKKIEKLSGTIRKLKDLKSGETLVKTCARKMYDRKFEESLDSNPYLLGFNNGVYDLKLRVFRNGEPDDRLTMNVNYDYDPTSPPQHIIKEINNCIKKIQPDKSMREYIYRFFASCLDGKNKDQSFRIFTGSGGNGKSVLMKLVELAFGEYYGTLPAAVLTIRDSGPNSASPFLADTRGKRCVFIHETESDAVLQLGKMKLITGSDKITTRKLFGDPFEFTPQFKLGLLCNKLPKIPSDDGGTWRRIRVTPFESKFVSADKVCEEKHWYLRDPNLDEEKLSEWSQTFMWMLINTYYPKYIAEGLCEPDKVREFSERYQESSDTILEFLKEFVVITGNEKDSQKTMDLFQQLKSWHKNNYNHCKFDHTKRDLEDYLVERRGLVVNNGVVLGVKSTLDCEL